MWKYNYTYPNSLYHHGIKGQKWGVRRTPEQLGHVKKDVAKTTNNDRIIIKGHKSPPKKHTPNSTIDHITENGNVKTRAFYDKNGMKSKEIHTTNHGNSKEHNYGSNGEHVHEYEWDSNGKLKNKSSRELTKKERKENSDIL